MSSEQIGTGAVTQLDVASAVAFIQDMLRKSAFFRFLHHEFTARGFQFNFDRAKVFVYLTRGDKGMSPNVIGILPSYVPVKASDPGHDAVSVVVHHSGFAVAAQVRVSHNPFQLVEFALHHAVQAIPKGGEAGASADKKSPDKPCHEGFSLVTCSLSAKELAHAPDEELEAHFTSALGPRCPEVDSSKVGDYAAPSLKMQSQIASLVYHELIEDEYARPLYTKEGLRSMLGDTPLVQKFAALQYAAFAAKAPASSASWCTSSSSSSNACTSTSTSSVFDLSLSQARV